MGIKAIALDLDGTLLNSDKTVSRENKRVLKELEKRGILIFISTGRPYTSTKKIIDDLEIEGLVISYNGAKVVDSKTDKVVYEKPLEEKYVKKIINLAREKGIHLNLYQNEVWYVENDMNEESEIYKKLTKLIPEKKNFDSFQNYEMTKTLFIGKNEILKEIEKYLKEIMGHDTYIAFSQPHFLEILHKDVNKGNALLTVLEKYSISSDECAAFGDAANDIEMLECVKYGVAMGNAIDIVKNRTDYITDTNDNDGVAKFLKNYFDGL